MLGMPREWLDAQLSMWKSCQRLKACFCSSAERATLLHEFPFLVPAWLICKYAFYVNIQFACENRVHRSACGPIPNVCFTLIFDLLCLTFDIYYTLYLSITCYPSVRYSYAFPCMLIIFSLSL